MFRREVPSSVSFRIKVCNSNMFILYNSLFYKSPQGWQRGAETCRRLTSVMNCISLSAAFGWYINCKNMQGTSKIKKKKNSLVITHQLAQTLSAAPRLQAQSTFFFAIDRHLHLYRKRDKNCFL